MQSPFPWFGGKKQLSRTIISLFPKHKIYVEPFGGSASVLFAKEPSELEVYNDLDKGLVNFFKVLADPNLFEQFKRRVEGLPYARQMWYDYRDEWKTEEDPVLRAAKWFYVARGSFGGLFGNAWCFGTTKSSRAPSWMNCIPNLAEFHKRVRRVQIECHPYEKILEAYDSHETLFYLDPPYVHDTRKSGKYRYELTNEEHKEMISRILKVKGMVVLSGYRHEIYEQLLKHGWQTKEINVFATSIGHTRDIDISEEDRKRTEVIYTSFPISLF